MHNTFQLHGEAERNDMQTQTSPIKPFGLRIPEEIKTWATEQARKERMSLNSWLLRMLDEKREGQHAKVA